MFKNINKLIILAIISFHINAEEITNNNCFYIGAGIGHSNINGIYNRLLLKFLTDKTINLGNTAIVGKFVMGYDILSFCCLGKPIYLNVEASHQLGDITIKTAINDIEEPRNFSVETISTKSNIIDIHAKLGFVHYQTVFYGKLGASYSNFKHRLRSVGNLDWVQGHTRKVGISGGAGILYRINNRWRAFFDYEVTKYPSLKFNLSKDGLEACRFRPTTYTVTTGIQYIF